MPLDDQSSGFWDSSTAIVDNTPAPVAAPLPSDSWWVPTWSPGSDTTPVPTADPAFNADPWAALKTVGNVVASGVSAASAFVTTKDNLSFQREAYNLKNQQTQAQLDLARTQIQSQAAVDQARIAAQTAIAQRQFAQMPALTSLFGGSSAPSQTDWLLLVLTAVGVYYAWRAVEHHG